MQWFITGLIIGAGVLALVLQLRRRAISLTWYEAVIGVVAVLLALVAAQHIFASLAELEVRAAWLGLLALGVPAVILMAIAAVLVWRRAAHGHPIT